MSFNPNSNLVTGLQNNTVNTSIAASTLRQSQASSQGSSDLVRYRSGSFQETLQRRTDSIFKEKELPDEVPLITTFCCKLDIVDGVSFSGGFDFFLGLIWAVLLLANIRSGLWPFYLLNTLIGLCRLKAFYDWFQNDTQEHRFTLFKTHSFTLIGYELVFFAHSITSWIWEKSFPIGLLFFQIVATLFMLYLLIVNRQHFLNCLEADQEEEAFDYGHILNQDLSHSNADDLVPNREGDMSILSEKLSVENSGDLESSRNLNDSCIVDPLKRKLDRSLDRSAEGASEQELHAVKVVQNTNMVHPENSTF